MKMEKFIWFIDEEIWIAYSQDLEIAAEKDFLSSLPKIELNKFCFLVELSWKGQP